MTCEVLNGDRFERVVSHHATAEDLAILRAHLETACEACLERLAEIEDERLLMALGGPRAELSAEEADRMFARATRPRRSLARPLALAASVLVAATTGAFWFGAEQETDLRDKGGGEIALELTAFAARQTEAGPVIDRPLVSGDRLAPGERVLFRYRLGTPAYLYLVTKSVRGEELAYAAPVRSPVGEHELAANGSALALDPAGMGPKIEVVAVASESPIDRAWLACDRCGRASLLLFAEPSEQIR